MDPIIEINYVQCQRTKQTRERHDSFFKNNVKQFEPPLLPIAKNSHPA